MKAVTVTTFFALIVFFSNVSFAPLYAASAGAMSGKYGYGSKGYNQAAKEKKMKGTKATKQPQ
jgi:hypothetical protein